MKNKILDIASIRSDFPILNQKINKQKLIYFDNAASSQKPKTVIDCLSNYYNNFHSNVHRGVHSLSQMATDAYENARIKIQKFINAPELEEVIFTKGTTDSINLVAHSFGKKFIKSGDEIIISAMEHHANIVPWQLLCEQTEAKLKVIPINQKGELLMEEFKRILSPKTKLVAISWISNSLGTINPIEEIIALAHQNNTPVLVDAAQALPHQKIDIKTLDCDFLAFSAHKMYGPTGIGILYGKRKYLDEMPPYQGGGDMIKEVTFEKTTYNDLPHKFEAGTPNIADGIAFGAAIDYLEKLGMENIAAYEKELLEYATEKLNQIEGLKIYGESKNKASVISFLLDGIHPYDTGTILDKYGIAIRTGNHCTQPIMKYFNISGTCRASFALYNTKTEIDYLIEVLPKVKMFF